MGDEGAKANNIYNLAGNIYLHTLRADSSWSGKWRELNGGSYSGYGTDNFASSVGYNNPKDSTYDIRILQYTQHKIKNIIQ